MNFVVMQWRNLSYLFTRRKVISFSAHFLPFPPLLPEEKWGKRMSFCHQKQRHSFRGVCTSVGYKITLNTFTVANFFKIFHLWWIQDWCVRKMMYPNEKWILWIWFLHLSRWLHSILKMLFLKRMSSGQRLLANFWVAAQQLVARFLGLLRF